MICNKCNFQNEKGALFCGSCGAKLNEKINSQKRTKPTKNTQKRFLVGMVLFLFFILIVFYAYNNAFTANNRLYVSEQCDPNVKLKDPATQQRKLNIGTDGFKASVFTPLCVTSEVAYIYNSPNQFSLKAGHVRKYDRLISLANHKNGFICVQTTDKGIVETLGWIKQSDIMEEDNRYW